MKNPIRMSDQQLTDWTNKTRNSISTFANAGGRSNSLRGFDLVDRYELLKEELMNRNQWEGFCVQDGADPSHNAFDLFA